MTGERGAPRSGVGKTADPRRSRARRGESLAAAWLRLKGYRIEARNWRCAAGEIDLIAWDGDTLVFVEVKARAGRTAGAPEEAVDRRKQERLVRLAEIYLSRLGDQAPECRFDVIAVEGSGALPRLRHLKAAFRADGLV
ncbi:MAG: YraN family protein [Acidobacteriota bacterium]